MKATKQTTPPTVGRTKNCGYRWTTVGTLIGSQHACAFDRDHDGDHYCFACGATCPREATS
jgi:hypothetical protein